MLLQKWRRALFVPGESKSARFFRIFPWVWLVAAYGITMLVLGLHGRACIDSDMSSEMVLADLLNREGGLLSTDWWYSTELRVFCLQPLYRLGLLLFPQNWYAARMLGQSLFMLVLILAYLYLARGLGLRNSGVWGAAALACPFGTWYLWYGAFGGFYLPHMVLVLLAFGAVVRLLKPAAKRRRIAQWILLFAASAASGLNGLKGLMGFYIPLVLAAAVALALAWHLAPRQLPRRELRLAGVSAAALLVAGGGYLFNSVFLAASHQYSDYNARPWAALSGTNLINKWMDFLTLFGYPVDSLLGGEVELFSLEGILAAFSLLIAGALVFSLVRLLLHWRELQPMQRVVPLLFASVCLVQGFVFACTGDVFSANASYWLTCLPLAFPVLQLEGETEHFRIPHIRRAAAAAFCVCFVAVSVSTTTRYFAGGYRINPHLEEVCDWLVDQGYTQGYATFWNGNVLTEWSDGKIEMWVTGNFNTMQPSMWLQKTSHANPPEGKVFLLTTREELGAMNLSELYWWSNVVYEDGEEQTDRNKRYVIMEYKDYNDMMAAVQGAQSWAQTGQQTGES